MSNAEYAAFLNAVARTDTLHLYNSSMSSGTAGGITRSGSSGSFTYSVKSANAGNQPVNFVSVYDAARYVNWLQNGAPTSVPSGSVSSVIHSGAYTLSNVENPGTALVRNIGATVFLPTRDEWFKAAYYSQSLNGGSGGSFTFSSGTNATPTASTNRSDTSTNVGYFNLTSSAVPLSVDALANTQSAYGAIGMVGNVSEWLEFSNVTQAAWQGDWFTMPSSQVSTWSSSGFAGALQSSMNQSGAQGFRIAAVPEPSTIMLAILGLATVGGGEIARRRKARSATALAA